MNSQDVLKEAIAVVNVANVHQLNTALELYYSDNDQYPLVNNGHELFIALAPYIKNKPLDEDVFIYESKNNGQDYSLSLY